MTTYRPVEDRISSWLVAEAPDQLPDRVLQATFERTRPIRQQRTLPRWTTLRLGNAWRLAGAAALIAVVLAVVVLPRNETVGPPSSTPSPSPDLRSLVPVSLAGQIAFERTVDLNTDIYVMNVDRSGLVRLTNDQEVDAEPAWSPDGSRIAFTRGSRTSGVEPREALDDTGRDVFVMNADGTGEVRITTTDEAEASPAFSPDGSRLVFVRYSAPTRFDLYVIDVDGSNERQVLHRTRPFITGPVWSSDGQSLFYNVDDSTDGGEIDVARLDLRTGATTLVTTRAGDDSTFALSPDGSTIAFQSDRDIGGMWLMDTDGSNVRHLTGSWEQGLPLSWSPDGQWLVYTGVDRWLYLVSAAGGDPIEWTEGGPSVAWRPQP